MALPFYVNYSGTITNSGGDTDLIEIAPASNKIIKLRRFFIGNSSIAADSGDAQEENLRISIIRLPATFTSGSGGSSPTITYPSANSGTVGATVEANNTTIATTSGTAATLYELSWNVRAPLEIVWYDDLFAPRSANAEGLVIRMQSTVSDDLPAVWSLEAIEE